MGCFSYICPKCKTNVRSSGVDGELCYHFFLVNGKVVEIMYGKYNLYGSVFKNDISIHNKFFKRPFSGFDESDKRKSAYHWEYGKWTDLVNLHFCTDLPNTGFAIYHAKCYNGKEPTTISEDDEAQGCGKLRDRFMHPE